jgi:hypothetical protein
MGFIEGVFLQLQPTVLRLELAVVVIYIDELRLMKQLKRSLSDSDP